MSVDKKTLLDGSQFWFCVRSYKNPVNLNSDKITVMDFNWIFSKTRKSNPENIWIPVTLWIGQTSTFGVKSWKNPYYSITYTIFFQSGVPVLLPLTDLEVELLLYSGYATRNRPELSDPKVYRPHVSLLLSWPHFTILYTPPRTRGRACWSTPLVRPLSPVPTR